MDSKAIASEIVYLKNRIARMEDDPHGDPAVLARLEHRKRELQGRLADDDHREQPSRTPADEVQFIPPA